ncbi:MAG: hypothetical protein CVU17_02695 [Betaproteobacteria bacterium HGW-Betaproteobacteria-11]|nr:MAG: hypothetical protein CVU17_02695 [Betaproteobacteria bacterium HGW-Betaproteobacteria-11]
MDNTLEDNKRLKLCDQITRLLPLLSQSENDLVISLLKKELRATEDRLEFVTSNRPTLAEIIAKAKAGSIAAKQV